MKEQPLMTIKQASQFLFNSSDTTHYRRTQRLIDKYNLDKITEGSTTYIRGQDLANALNIKPPSNKKLKAAIIALLEEDDEPKLQQLR